LNHALGYLGIYLAMMEHFIAILSFAVSMFWTPGPNNAMLASSAATYGLKRTWQHLNGVAIGFPVMVFIVAVGAAAFLQRNPWIHIALKWTGIVYLLWLAWKIATSKKTKSNGKDDEIKGSPLTFFQASLFQWINPKGWILAVSTIATFTSPPTIWQDMALIVPMFLAVGYSSTIFWTLTGAGAAHLLTTERRLRYFNYSMAGCLVFSLLFMIKE
jgi:threonine/homoserine/homoserine lactone efflux protein